MIHVSLRNGQERERVRWEEQRKAMQQDASTKAELARYGPICCALQRCLGWPLMRHALCHHTRHLLQGNCAG